MKLKNKHTPRRSTGLTKPSAAASPLFALPAGAAISRRLGLRVGALSGVAAAVAGILYCAGGAYAADETAPAASAADTTGLDEIVVTASAQGVKKLDASFNIVSVSIRV